MKFVELDDVIEEAVHVGSSFNHGVECREILVVTSELRMPVTTQVLHKNNVCLFDRFSVKNNR